MKEETSCRLLIGLGNPGIGYENTRHNMGVLALKAFAKKYGFTFQRASHLQSEIAIGKVNSQKVLLLIPAVYMNHSGISVRQCMDYYQIPAADILVVCDDIALPLGSFRFRVRGTVGGHNGLKSVESHVRTKDYARVRIGIGDREHGELADYVLGHFTKDEVENFPPLFDKVVNFLTLWIQGEITYAFTSRSTEKIKNEKKLGE